MEPRLEQQLCAAAERLHAKKMYGRPGDSISLRVPGTDDWIWLVPGMTEPATSNPADAASLTQDHGAIYARRPDAGALLFSTTIWSEQLAALQKSPPTLFDEPARHIGRVAPPVKSGDLTGLLHAVRRRTNVAVYGSQMVRIGMTADRVIFNTELFEKCAMAFVIAHSSGERIRTVPGWVRYIAGGRLQKDQQYAAECYAGGRIPDAGKAY